MSSVHTKYSGILISLTICIGAAKVDLFRPLSCNPRQLRNVTPQGCFYIIGQIGIQEGLQVVLLKDLV